MPRDGSSASHRVTNLAHQTRRNAFGIHQVG